jgi:hypothetical protein
MQRVRERPAGLDPDHGGVRRGSPGSDSNAVGLLTALGRSQIIEGLWRFEALLPDWTEQDGDEDGWEQNSGGGPWRRWMGSSLSIRSSMIGMRLIDW